MSVKADALTTGSPATLTALTAALGEKGPIPMARGRQALHFPNHLRRFRQKLSAANFRQAVIGVYGHSIVAGGYANDVLTQSESDWRVKSMVPQVRKMFANTYGDVGEGVLWFGDTAATNYTLSGAAVKESGTTIGYGGTRLKLPDSTAKATITTPQCTSIDLVMFGGFGAVRYTVDGGSVQSLATGASNTVFSASITGLTDATHVVEIIGPSSGAAYVVSASFLRDATKGVAVHRYGYSGKCAASCFAWADPTSVRTTDEKDRQLSSCTSTIGVDLAVLMFDVNDTTDGWTTFAFTPTTLQASIQQLVTKIVGLGIDVLLITGPAKDPTTVTSPYTQAEYDAAYRNVAAATDRCALLDITAMQDSYADSFADGFYIDYVHPKMQGHAYIARALHSALLNL